MKKLTLIFICILTAQLVNAQEADKAATPKKLTGITSGGGSKGYGIMKHNHGKLMHGKSTNKAGCIYQFNISTGKDTIPVNIKNKTGSSQLYGNPYGSLIQAKNGLMYGMTNSGGSSNEGVMFCFNPATGKDSLLFSFLDSISGSYPLGSLIQGFDGMLYGMTPNGGYYGYGVLFRYDPVKGKDSILYDFDYYTGGFPNGDLVQGKDSLLYGVTSQGGDSDVGVLFNFDLKAGFENVLYSFGPGGGKTPNGTLMQATDGLLYGMAYEGGANDYGTIFNYDPVYQIYTDLYDFDYGSGAYPQNGNLYEDTTAKMLYGMTSDGGGGAGVLFSYDMSAQNENPLLFFNDTAGAAPYGSLMYASNGLLYGLTTSALEKGKSWGTIFSFNTKTGLENYYTLNGYTAGGGPYGNLIQTSSGLLYGMTNWGGTNYGGVLFSYDYNKNTDSVYINFNATSSSTGTPNSSLMAASNGLLYGTNEFAGKYAQGQIFSFDPTTGKDTVLFNFNGTTTGTFPVNLTQFSDSILFGMTYRGGTSDAGTIFRFNLLNATCKTVLNFDSLNGLWPDGGLIKASDGLLYGMTTYGDSSSSGSSDGNLFSFDAGTNKINLLLNFNDTLGYNPFGSLLQATDKNIYGMTCNGGVSDGGILFSYGTTTKKLNVLFSFNGGNGLDPFGTLIQGTDGLLYGMAQEGGDNNEGVFFSYNITTKKDSTLFSFIGPNGAYPSFNNLVQDSSTGLIYGTTASGGANNFGVLFSYNPATNKDSTLLSFNDSTGANPTSIVLTGGGPTGIEELKQVPKDLVIVYPNPFTSIATVLFHEVGKHYLELDDLQGNKLRWISTTNIQYNIARDGLPAGLYILKFYDAEQHYISFAKIVVQ